MALADGLVRKMLRVRDVPGDILLLPRGERPPAGAERVSTMLTIARLDRLDPFELRRMKGYRTAEDVEKALRRGDLVAFRQMRRRVVVELETPLEPVLGPSGAEDEEKPEIAVILFDSAGERLDVECEIALPDEEKGRKVKLSNGTVRLDAKRDGICSIAFPGLKSAEKLPIEAAPVDPVANAELLTRRYFERVFKKRTRSVAHIFQLERKKATVIELEHFTEDGAVFLPGFSPARLRESAPQVTGIDALKAIFERCKNEKHVLVTGHHAIVSKERAESVQFLLMGNRFAWAALSQRVAKPEDKVYLRAWASEPLPEDDAAWTTETWGGVFDLYVKEIAPQAPAPTTFTKHPRIEVHLGKNFVPYIVAQDATGDAERYVEMNPLNPTKPKGASDRGWKPTYPGETVWLPDGWDPFVEKLVAAGWHAFHGERDAPPPPEPPHLEHAPRALGCGDHHLEHPYAKSPERRAEKRHAEVVILPDDALACSHDGPCDMSTCDVYDPTAFDHDVRNPLSTGPHLSIATFIGLDPSASLLVLDAGGAPIARLGMSDAEAEDGLVTWRLDPDRLPPLTTLQFTTAGGVRHHAGPFNAVAVRDALARHEVALAALLLQSSPPSGFAAGPPGAAQTSVLVEVSFANARHRFVEKMSVKCAAGTSPTALKQVQPKSSSPGNITFEVKGDPTHLEFTARIENIGDTSKPAILNVVQKFVRDPSTGKVTARDGKNNGLHPRLKFRSTASPGTPSASSVVQLDLDVRFLDVSARHASKLSSMLPPGSKCKGLVLEHTGGIPVVWAVLVPPAAQRASPGVNFFLFFQHEVKTLYTSTDDAPLGRYNHYFRSEAIPGSYLLPDMATQQFEFTEYPAKGFDAQLANSGKPVMLVMPLPLGDEFGTVQKTTAALGESLFESLIACLWDSGTIPANIAAPPRLIRAACGGWSSGTTAMHNWLSANVPKIEEAYLFDGRTNTAARVPEVESWWRPGRKVRYVGTGHTEQACIQSHGRLAAVVKAQKAKDPSVSESDVSRRPASITYWYTNDDYRRAHRYAQFDGSHLPPPANSATPMNATSKSGLFLKGTPGDANYPSIPAANSTDHLGAVVRLNFASGGGEVKLISETEAASLVRFKIMSELFQHRTPKTTLPVQNAAELAFVTDKLRNSGNKDEPDTIEKLRHPWSLHGGEWTGTTFRGYVELCLRDSGFF
jgi:hypothetical protein